MRLTDPALARSLGRLCVWVGLVGMLSLGAVGVMSRPAGGQQQAPPRGPDLYQQHCAYCHGVRGQGTYSGPSLVGVGTASADFYLRSGRMPLPHPRAEAERGEVLLDEAQIRELVNYVGELGDGPAIPDVSSQDADVAEGGDLYRVNCASCHNWDGRGGALMNRENAPPVHGVPATQIAEAVRIGPGTMPVFSERTLTPAQVDDIVAYVEYLDEPRDAGGYGLGHWGPTTEMFVAFIGLGALLLLTGWLGERG